MLRRRLPPCQLQARVRQRLAQVLALTPHSAAPLTGRAAGSHQLSFRFLPTTRRATTYPTAPIANAKTASCGMLPDSQRPAACASRRESWKIGMRPPRKRQAKKICQALRDMKAPGDVNENEKCNLDLATTSAAG